MAYYLDCSDIPGDSQHQKHKKKVKIYRFSPPLVTNSLYEQANASGVMSGQSRVSDASFRCLLDQSSLTILTMLVSSKTADKIVVFNEGTMNTSGTGSLTTETLHTYTFQHCVFSLLHFCYDERGSAIDYSGAFSQAMAIVSFRFNNYMSAAASHEGAFGGTGSSTSIYSKMRGATKR